MNKKDDDIDLGLALGSTSNCSKRSMKKSSGAGVNANSRVDMGFAASDPLSELVWSPNNGLSLKCTESGLADKKPFLLDVGESSKRPPTLQSIRSRGTDDEKVDDELKLTISPTALNVDIKFVDNATLRRSPRISPGPELSPNHGSRDEFNGKMEEEVGTTNAIYKVENIENGEDYDICSSQNFRIADIAQTSKENAEQDTYEGSGKVDMVGDGQFSGRLSRRAHCKKKTEIAINASSSHIMGLDVAIHSELHVTNLSEDPICSLMNSRSIQESDNEVAPATEEVCKNKRSLALPATPLRRLESSAENVLLHTAKEARSLGEIGLQKENSLPVERSPTNSRIRLYQEKGKERALSDGDICGRLSNEDDGSHDTVESCNSAGFVKGIKRQNSDEELTSRSKRMKNLGSYASTPIFGPHSSFMNLISNMVKGLQDLGKEEPSSRALALARSSDVDGKNQQENFICIKGHDSAKRGFKTMFQSLYSGNTKMPDCELEKENYSTEESKELMAVEKISFENLPRPFDGKISHSCKRVAVSNEEEDPHISGQSLNKPWIVSADFPSTSYACENDLVENKASKRLVCSRGQGFLCLSKKEEDPHISGDIFGRSTKPPILSSDFPSTSYACESVLAENKASKRSVCNREKKFLSLSDTLEKQVDSTSDNTNLNIPLTTSEISEKGNPFSSLWITRLCTRSPIIETCNQITREVNEFSTLCPEDNNTSCQMNDGLFIGKESSEARDVSPEKIVLTVEKQKCVFAAKSEASVDLNSLVKLSPTAPSPKLKSSEAMASSFARRLDALRHIIPSETRNSSSYILTCFFCGRNGHGLQDCPDITETELEDLLVRVSSLEKVEESSCLCIRCFQLDHWAISCPSRCARRRFRSEKNASSTSHCSANPLQHSAGIANRSNYPCLSSFPGYLSCNVTESSSKRSCEIQKVTASNSHFPKLNFIAAQNRVAPVEMFQAIRKLRLSRGDVLRWMSSNISLGDLNGFFLRLRLVKLEEGQGKTGYYVARITGDVKENACPSSKKLITVDVGGIQSFVESPYISNHDFLEDEINAWWCKMVKGGGSIPSLDELDTKLNDRRNLGF